MRHLLVLAFCLLLMAASAGAEEGDKAKPAKPLTIEQVADRVRQAVEAKDTAALQALAAQDRPDPWLVPDLLCQRRAFAAAAAFAQADARQAVAKLAAHVTTRSAADDGGSLSCRDVFRLTVAADLVVLSACETGKGLSAAAALRQAQAHIRGHAQWKHPYYWAAWVLWGLPD